MHIPLASDAELATTPIQHSTIQPIRVIPSVLSAVIHNIGQHICDTTIGIGVGIIEQNGQFRYIDHSILLKSVTLIPYGTSIRYGKGYCIVTYTSSIVTDNHSYYLPMITILIVTIRIVYSIEYDIVRKGVEIVH